MFTLNTSEGQEFIRKLAIIQKKWAEVLLEDLNKDSQLLTTKINKLEPLYNDKSLMTETPTEFIIDIFEDILGLLLVYQPKLKEQLTIMKKNLAELYEFMINGVENAIIHWADTNKVSPLLVGQVIDWVLRPQKMAIGHLIKPMLQGDGENNSCPVCREEADIAFLQKENGERHLGCSGCQVEWNYPRLKCPTCGNTDPETLKYFFVEEAPFQQIHYCQLCNTYLKTFDYRFTKEQYEDFLILNLMTLHLDILAEEKGLGLRSIN